MISGMVAGDFDAVALYYALDAQRTERGLSWRQAADQIWEQSAVLNAQRSDHPISPSTLAGMARRGNCTCQHALFFLRWLDRTPESFLVEPRHAAGLPKVGADRRLRWNLKALYDAVNTLRREKDVTWIALAQQLRCTPSQLTGLRTVRFAIGMRLAMRLTQWVQRPAADFVCATKW